MSLAARLAKLEAALRPAETDRRRLCSPCHEQLYPGTLRRVLTELRGQARERFPWEEPDPWAGLSDDEILAELRDIGPERPPCVRCGCGGDA